MKMIPNIQIGTPQNIREILEFVDIGVKDGKYSTLPTLKQGNIITLLAFENDQVVGGLVCATDRMERKADLEYIAVHPYWAGLGIEDILLDELIIRLENSGTRTIIHTPSPGTITHVRERGFYPISQYGQDMVYNVGTIRHP